MQLKLTLTFEFERDDDDAIIPSDIADGIVQFALAIANEPQAFLIGYTAGSHPFYGSAGNIPIGHAKIEAK
jgi:hypothetical protein